MYQTTIPFGDHQSMTNNKRKIGDVVDWPMENKQSPEPESESVPHVGVFTADGLKYLLKALTSVGTEHIRVKYKVESKVLSFVANDHAGVFATVEISSSSDIVIEAGNLVEDINYMVLTSELKAGLSAIQTDVSRVTIVHLCDDDEQGIQFKAQMNKNPDMTAKAPVHARHIEEDELDIKPNYPSVIQIPMVMLRYIGPKRAVEKGGGRTCIEMKLDNENLTLTRSSEMMTRGVSISRKLPDDFGIKYVANFNASMLVSLVSTNVQLTSTAYQFDQNDSVGHSTFVQNFSRGAKFTLTVCHIAND